MPTKGNLSGVFLADLDHPPYQVLGNGLLLLLLLAIAFFTGKAGFEADPDFEGRHILFILSAGAIFLSYLALKRLRQAMHARFGLAGHGVRVFASREIAIASIQPGPNGSSDPLNSVVLQSEGQRYAGSDIIMLVNILRTLHGNWAIGHLVVKTDDDQLLLKLEFVKAFIVRSATSPNTTGLYVAERGRFSNLLSSDLTGDFRKMSTALRPSGARLKLTFTEYSSGVVGGLAGVAVSAALSKSKQAKANRQLEAGQLPVETDLQEGVASIVKEFRYELVPNEDFSPLGACADK